jgi:stage II sporulation protein GA (sporulation sigma-E factor processing peptidase)
MVVYAEYLFLENGLAGLIVLILTGQICGFPIKWLRMILGSISCGLYAFTLFCTSMPFFISVVLKLLFSLAVLFLVFPCRAWKRFGQGVLVFYIVSLAMGGVTIGVMYFVGLIGVAGIGGFYLGNINYRTVILGMIVTWMLFSVFISFLKGRLWKERVDMDVEIEIGGVSKIIRGMVDTGNFLCDPISGRPVFLVTENLVKGLMPEWNPPAICERSTNECILNRYRLIPFRSIGKEKGLLTGVRPDRVVLYDRHGGPRAVEIILGIYEGSFPADRDGISYELLLNPAVMEEGVLNG